MSELVDQSVIERRIEELNASWHQMRLKADDFIKAVTDTGKLCDAFASFMEKDVGGYPEIEIEVTNDKGELVTKKVSDKKLYINSISDKLGFKYQQFSKYVRLYTNKTELTTAVKEATKGIESEYLIKVGDDDVPVTVDNLCQLIAKETDPKEDDGLTMMQRLLGTIEETAEKNLNVVGYVDENGKEEVNVTESQMKRLEALSTESLTVEQAELKIKDEMNSLRDAHKEQVEKAKAKLDAELLELKKSKAVAQQEKKLQADKVRGFRSLINKRIRILASLKKNAEKAESKEKETEKQTLKNAEQTVKKAEEALELAKSAQEVLEAIAISPIKD